jgi:hypothetical protein
MMVIGALGAGWLFPGGASAYEFGPTVQQTGPEEVVFDWTTQRCDDEHYPDLPARAYRDSSNQVNLTTSHWTNRRMKGPSLNSVAVDCTITMSSHANADPSAYDDMEWIASPYTLDGKTVYALVHEEYQGWNHPGMCSSQGQPSRPKLSTAPAPLAGFDPTCWYNSITFATSTNGGATYTHAAPPGQLLASVPYQYVANTGPYGYFQPSNIIRKPSPVAGETTTASYFYFFVQAEAYQAQEVGVCAVRSRNPLNIASWRAWDGVGFNRKFINPYLDPGPPEEHVCEPVDWPALEKLHSSVTSNSYFAKYLMIGEAELPDPKTGDPIWGIYYSTSTDLIDWSPRQLLMKAELTWTWECGDENPILYPALLNPNSASRNFETTGKKTYLYFTRHNWESCVTGPDRDLIRIPIQFIP